MNSLVLVPPTAETAVEVEPVDAVAEAAAGLFAFWFTNAAVNVEISDFRVSSVAARTAELSPRPGRVSRLE
jgi:hypothetical protein